MDVELHRERGRLWATVAQMPGCFAAGRDAAELADALAEAAEMWSGHPVDVDWREKIATAREAMELGRRLRAGKPGTFRRGIGRMLGPGR